MRGDPVAQTQAFLGHLKYPLRVIWQDDMKFLYSIGEGNGIFKWSFYGEKDMPLDITLHYEKFETKDQEKISNQTKG